MGRIRVLDDPLINRIAAGEVVERPASVVKELVENSLDAGAGSIQVQLRTGGRQRVQVDDDGCGLDADDAVLAVERHATSKLAAIRDLSTIGTLGFRGEALASIAAVSRFTLRTAPDDGEGTEIEIHGGRIQAVRRVGLPRGCSVQVDRLFYNMPARRKFLRSESTELSHCLRWLTRYALAHPDKRFHVSHGQRRLLDLAPVGQPGERIVQIYGAEFADRLLPFDRSLGRVRFRGFAGRPVQALPRRDAQHYFVNGRAVQDRVLSHAVHQAYANTMPHGRYPALFVYIELPADEVDVNVHPQKTEVRFGNSGAVHDGLREVLLAALSEPASVPTLTDLRPESRAAVDSIREAILRYGERREPAAGTAVHDSAPVRPAPDDAGLCRPAVPRQQPPLPAASSESPSEASARSPGLHDRAPRAVQMAQLRDSYIVAEDEQGLVLVDQHAAHERVLFEKYLEDAEENRVAVQRLLFPATVELTPHERATLEGELEEFERLGFSVEPFGGCTVRLDAVPAIATDLDPEALLRELLGEARESKSAATDVAQLRRRLITTAACQSAIKINHPLTGEGRQRLLDDLYKVDNPTTCPHGRPILFRLTLDEIERAFRRK